MHSDLGNPAAKPQARVAYEKPKVLPKPEKMAWRCINCIHANADGWCRMHMKYTVLDAPQCRLFGYDAR